MEKELTRKLDIKETMVKSAQIYRNNFGVLFTLSLLSMLLSEIPEVFSGLKALNFASVNQQIAGILSFVGLLAGLILIFYSIKMSLAVELAIRDLLKDKVVSVRESFKNTKGRTWKVIATVIVIIFMIAIPIIMIQFGIQMKGSLATRAILIGIGLALLAVIGVNVMLAPIIRNLEPKNRNYFRYSKKLVKGNFFTVMILLTISSTALIVNLVIGELFDVSTLGVLGRILFEVVPPVFSLIFRPFQSSIMVITFLSLSENRKDTVQVSK